MLGAYGRDVLNDNGKLMLDFAEKKQARFSEHFFFHLQKWRVLHVPKRQLQQGISTFGPYPEKGGGTPTGPMR